MREFFYGWRRKAGCVSLAMALVLMAGWIRSFTITDLYMVGDGWIVSSDGLIEWLNYSFDHDRDPIEPPTSGPPAEITVSVVADDVIVLGSPGAWHVATWIVPYWSMVVPLTILSAYLILGKPRKRGGMTHSCDEIACES